jgi:hypothetical protein
MGDAERRVGKRALNIANGLFSVFFLNQATDLEWKETGGVEAGRGSGCGCGKSRFWFWATIVFFIPRLIESDMLLQLFVFFFL